jgi:hypothetical protein
MNWRSLFWVVVCAAVPAAADTGQDIAEPGSREAIAQATTDPRFLSPWVAYTPDSSLVPSPAKFLGHVVGAPGELTRTDKILAYYRALAAATPRVKVEVIGRSEEGREILLVIVGDEASLAQLDRIRTDMADLADPRRTGEAAMEAIVARAKPLYMLHGGLYSTETGSPRRAALARRLLLPRLHLGQRRGLSPGRGWSTRRRGRAVLPGIGDVIAEAGQLLERVHGLGVSSQGRGEDRPGPPAWLPRAPRARSGRPGPSPRQPGARPDRRTGVGYGRGWKGASHAGFGVSLSSWKSCPTSSRAGSKNASSRVTSQSRAGARAPSSGKRAGVSPLAFPVTIPSEESISSVQSDRPAWGELRRLRR